MANDYIPQSDSAFLEWAKTLLAYVSPKLAAFNIPQGALPPIQAQLTAYEAALPPFLFMRGKHVPGNYIENYLYKCFRA
jgi:hypothetical protein